MNEAELMTIIRLEATRKGVRLWRNNVGVMQDTTGRPIRYGLANDSSALNAILKSSDLIGIRPVIITQEMVGLKVGQFVAREIKSTNWIYKDTTREKAQKAFIDLINSMGGDASFCNSEGTL